jgi:pyruvate/2-oxoglutarate dehydrogenase complex dihydrolipoamide dehydrogenase (E3) component/uncharacterized membrane protein YdjX (TVP38/TMEM64 family)
VSTQGELTVQAEMDRMATDTQPPGPAAGSAGRQRALRVVAALAAAGALVVLAGTVPADRYLLDFVAWIRGAGTTGMAAFAVAYVLACVLFLPGSILTLGAGFAYGVTLGTPLVWLSANVGAACAFVLGRTVARRWIAARVASNPRFAAIDRAVGRQGLKIVLLTRLSPVFPFNVLNYAFGLTRVTLRDFVLGSLVGMLPGTVMYVYLGSLITSLTELAAGRPSSGTAQQVFYFAGLAATVGVTLYVTRVARRALAEATGTAATGAGSGVPAGAPRARRDEAAPRTDAPRVLPDDEHNRTLLSHTHPPRWVNPRPAGRYNLVVVGAGTAGLVSAAGAAGLGARVALVERHLLGGDCLNVGCVPSKGLISAARVAALARAAGAFGVRTAGVEVDFPAVMARMRRLRARIAPNDGAERFTRLGVDVYFGDGRFTGPTTLEVDGRTLAFTRAVVTTGARAAAPAIPGLDTAGYLTNETLFWLTDLPRRLAVIGAGPIGCEMAQAFRRFGSEVTLFEATAHVLPREDADAAAIVERHLQADGVRIARGTQITRVERRGAEKVVHFATGGGAQALAVDAILVGVGRAPNVEGLGLDAAGVAFDATGVAVNDFLQTTNRRIYAAGDIASRYKFTHTADALARIVLTNALFAGRQRASTLHVPWCTYTSPEIAHVGLSEREAAARGLAVHTITVPLADVDRAILDGTDDGFLRVHLKRGTDRILGATLVAEHAGEMISEITVAMAGGIGLGTIARTIHPYPTQAEVIKKAADTYNRSRLTPMVKRIFARWLAWRR